MKKIFLFLAVIFLLSFCSPVLAHMPHIIYGQDGDVKIDYPENSQAFYDELFSKRRNYFISSSVPFNLYLNLLVPAGSNPDGRYSASVIFFTGKNEKIVATLDGNKSEWNQFYESFGRDYYYKGPELEKEFPAGEYKIEVFKSEGENSGKYVLAIGKNEAFLMPESLNVFWQLPLLKMQFFKTSVLEFFFTPFGIAGIAVASSVLLFLIIMNFIIVSVLNSIKNRGARTILLTSAGMVMQDQIIKLLEKPAYNITVAFITTAYKYKSEENPSYVDFDLQALREMGFNVEEIDIEGKRKKELMKLLELKDIIFVEGGNAFYLMKAIRKSGFEKVIRKLLKRGKVYIGASAGSIVAGKSLNPAVWLGDENFTKLSSVKAMNLIPFDIFPHYKQEHAQIIKKKLPFKWQRRRLKILTDEQAILFQGNERILIGEGDAVKI